MPLRINNAGKENLTIRYQNKSKTINPENFKIVADEKGHSPINSMLVLPRLTRIYFLGQFFKYPIQLTASTLRQLGLGITLKITFSYLYARLFPRKPENTLEDFMINRFGKTLYHLFFKDYTEKVWGVACNQISAEWGAQRIKGVSLGKAVIHAAKSLIKKKKAGINQDGIETSMIEQFLYPAGGAGSMWEEVARQVEAMGGEVLKQREVKRIITNANAVIALEVLNTQTGQLETFKGDHFFSTMPVQELVAGITGNIPDNVRLVAKGLEYRDFVYAAILVKKMAVGNLKDNWIYIQEKNVKVARIQLYNNWGSNMVKDPNTSWLGLEYFCNKGDEIWNLDDEEIREMAIKELVEMKLVYRGDIIDSTVQRMEKAYPSYTGSYHQFDSIREYLDGFRNLFLIGRNGMHKYNNADHSMLTAMTAVDNIIANSTKKENIWSINTEQDYHED